MFSFLELMSVKSPKSLSDEITARLSSQLTQRFADQCSIRTHLNQQRIAPTSMRNILLEYTNVIHALYGKKRLKVLGAFKKKAKQEAKTLMTSVRNTATVVCPYSEIKSMSIFSKHLYCLQ